MTPDTGRWHWTQRLLHWLMALGLAGNVVLGFVLDTLGRGPVAIRWFGYHKSIGLSLLLLVLLRLLARAIHTRPGLPPQPRWERVAHACTQSGLYLTMLLLPLSGWLYNSASGFPLRWFGWFGVPALSGSDPALKSLALAVHQACAWALVALVLVHVAAALDHHFRRRDRVLREMLGLRGDTL